MDASKRARRRSLAALRHPVLARAMEDFILWSNARGIDTSRVDLRVDPHTRARAVVCASTAKIKAGEVAVRVPFTACLGTTGLRCGYATCPLDDGDVGSSKQFYTPSDRLAATLAHARFEAEGGTGGGDRDGGAWRAYVVDALPQTVDSPVTTWTNAEIAEMAFARGIGNCAKAKARDAGTIKKLNEKYGDASWTKHFAWALSCVRSRAVDLERGESFLAPMLDMLNHSHGAANVKWDASDDGEAVVLRALKTIDEGEELLTQYACEPAESFLLYMGFVGGMNPYDRVELWSSLGEAADWFAETFRSEGGEVVLDKAAGRSIANELEAQQRARERASIVGLSGGGGTADDAAELRLRDIQSTLMGPSVGWRTDYDEALWLMFRHFTQALMPDENADQIVMHAIKKRCEEVLLSMKTTIEEDEKLFSAEDTPPRLRAAVEYRLFKKCLLVKHLQSD
jgi:histone-lysine N-methyltransferase SETD3|tara:strand:- start:2516 stop:3880 length:1365 start_codon:yes stop_codon:yes gene_type:complete